jgi:hypothetical protein
MFRALVVWQASYRGVYCGVTLRRLLRHLLRRLPGGGPKATRATDRAVLQAKSVN